MINRILLIGKNEKRRKTKEETMNDSKGRGWRIEKTERKWVKIREKKTQRKEGKKNKKGRKRRNRWCGKSHKSNAVKGSRPHGELPAPPL